MPMCVKYYVVCIVSCIIVNACLDKNQQLTRPCLNDGSPQRSRQVFVWSETDDDIAPQPIMAVRRTGWAFLLVLHVLHIAQAQLTACTPAMEFEDVRGPYTSSCLRSGLAAFPAN